MAAPIGLDVPHVGPALGGYDLSAADALQSKENDVSNVALDASREPAGLGGCKAALKGIAPPQAGARGVLTEVAVAEESREVGQLDAAGEAERATAAAAAAEDLRDLRGQLRQLVESLRTGSSGLSLAQVKARVTDLRGRIAAIEAS